MSIWKNKKLLSSRYILGRYMDVCRSRMEDEQRKSGVRDGLERCLFSAICAIILLKLEKGRSRGSGLKVVWHEWLLADVGSFGAETDTSQTPVSLACCSHPGLSVLLVLDVIVHGKLCLWEQNQLGMSLFPFLQIPCSVFPAWPWHPLQTQQRGAPMGQHLF